MDNSPHTADPITDAKIEAQTVAKKFLSHKKLLLFAFVLVYLSFSFPLGMNSLWSHFFPSGFLHFGYRGLDFYQVPRGAFTFFQGGSISGGLERPLDGWAAGQVSNLNAYHPLFTLVVGGFLQLFSHTTAQWVWHAGKLFSTAVVFAILARRFYSHRFFVLASALYFCNVALFHEIQILQYQSLLNVFLFVFLLSELNNKTGWSGLGLTAALLCKPFAIFFAPLLFVRKRTFWQPFFIGLALVACTLPFFFFPQFSYFFENIKKRVLDANIFVASDLLSFQGAFAYWGISTEVLKALKWVFLGVLFALAISRRISVFTLLFCLTVHWLCFDQLIYEYHFITLIPFFVCGLLSNREELQSSWQSLPARIFMVWASLPSLYILFYISGWGLRPDKQMELHSWALFLLWKFLPLVALCAVLLAKEWRASAQLLRIAPARD